MGFGFDGQTKDDSSCRFQDSRFVVFVSSLSCVVIDLSYEKIIKDLNRGLQCSTFPISSRKTLNIALLVMKHFGMMSFIECRTIIILMFRKNTNERSQSAGTRMLASKKLPSDFFTPSKNTIKQKDNTQSEIKIK